MIQYARHWPPTPRFPAKFSRRLSSETRKCEPKLLTISYGTGQRIVREALRMVLEAVFDPSFLAYSHGHRPGRGEHSALKEIRRWVGISWFLKFRVGSCDGDSMKNNLMQELRRVVGDPSLLSLLQNSVSQKWHRQRKTTKLGRLLSNIYLHQFDLSVARTMGLYKRGDVQELLGGDGGDGGSLLKRQGVRHVMIASSPEYRRLWYVRHGTELLMGFIGTRDEASDIFHDSKLLIEGIGIILNRRKSGNVADSMQNPASFLGMRIVCDDPGKPERPNRQETEWKTRLDKIQAIREEDRKRRALRKYVKVGMNSMTRALDSSFQVSGASTRGSTGFWKLVLKHFGEVIPGPRYRNLYHVMSPGEILLNRRTQSVFPPELTQAAKDLEEALKAFVEESSKRRSDTRRNRMSRPKKRELMITPAMTPPEFYAPIQNIRNMLNNSMFLDRGRPVVHPYLCGKSEIEIVNEFARVAESLLGYYKCTKNLERVKRMVDYNLRFSCLRTLGKLHGTTARKVKNIFTTDLIVPAEGSGGIALRRPYPTSVSLLRLKQGFLARDNPPPPWKVLQMYSYETL